MLRQGLAVGVLARGYSLDQSVNTGWHTDFALVSWLYYSFFAMECPSSAHALVRIKLSLVPILDGCLLFSGCLYTRISSSGRCGCLVYSRGAYSLWVLIFHIVQYVNGMKLFVAYDDGGYNSD